MHYQSIYGSHSKTVVQPQQHRFELHLRRDCCHSKNRRLKRMYAKMSMQNDLLKEALGKSSKAIPKEGDGR